MWENLTQLVCPLCGRYVSTKRFDPYQFERDIYVVELMGLGRRKGFKEVGSYRAVRPQH
jgi:hypothetical protein